MIAFALSGGGNRGPLQVGALKGLLESGIRPDFLVGTSAGALNAGYLAAWGIEGSVDRMAALWRQVDKDLIYPGGWLKLAWRVLTGTDSLYPNEAFREAVTSALPRPDLTFGELKIPCYITASDLLSRQLYLFPDPADKSARVADAILASASVPVLHPPVTVATRQLVDGGVIDNVPASIAMDKGATEIYLINVGYTGAREKPAQGLLSIFNRTIGTFLAQSLFEDIAAARERQDVDLHHVTIGGFSHLSFNDFSQSDAMIQAGYEAMQTYLADPDPRRLPVDGFAESAHGRSVGIPGAVPYTPSRKK